MRVDIETSSALSAGQTVCDIWGRSPLGPNATVALVSAHLRQDSLSNLTATVWTDCLLQANSCSSGRHVAYGALFLSQFYECEPSISERDLPRCCAFKVLQTKGLGLRRLNRKTEDEMCMGCRRLMCRLSGRP